MNKLKLVLTLVLAPLALLASSLPWQTDLEVARAESEATGKPLMMLFTGSDWCSWCMRLENEVLSQAEFADSVADKFVFVMVDKPRRNPLPAEQAARNAALFSEYKIASVPTVMVIGADGTQLGSTGFREGGAPAFAQHLLSLTENAE